MKISNTVINYNKLTSVIALIVFLALTIILYFYIEKNNNDITAREFEYRAQEIQTAIEHRINEYRHVLRSGAGLFEASDTVEREDWRKFVETLNINESYPGIQGVGFTKRILPKDMERHVESIRKEGFLEYRVWPEGKRDEYTSIIYLEPFSGRNLRAFGYDMFSEPVRHKAMSEARDNGRAAVSGKVILVQETGKGVQSGFLMYLPLYKNDMPVTTEAERRNALLGYVYSPFRMNDLLQGILGNDLPDVHLLIYDGKEISENALMYNSDSSVVPENSAFEKNVTVRLIDHYWTMKIRSLPVFEERNETGQQITVLIAGIIISILLSVLVRSYSITRARAVALSNEIIERQKAEEALKRSEERFRLITESARDLISMTDEQGYYVYTSPSFYSLLKYTQDDLKGIKAEELIHPDDMGMINNWEASRLYQFRVRKKDGTFLWVEGLAYPVEMQNKFYVIGAARDITERRKAEEELKTQKWRAEVLAGLSMELAEATLQYGTVLSIGTQRTAELIGDATILMLMSDDGKKLQPVCSYHPDPDLRKHIQENQYALPVDFDGGLSGSIVKSGKPLYIENFRESEYSNLKSAELKSLTEKIQFYAMIIVPLLVGRRLIGTITVFRTSPGKFYSQEDFNFLQQLSERIALAIDNARLHEDKIHEIEERKKTETILKRTLSELERSNKDLEEFAYVASHDLQEPLRMVASYTQLIAKRYKGKLDARADEFISFASEGAQRMQRLIHDLLEYSRVTSKGKPFEPVNTSEIVESVLKDLQMMIKESKAEITHNDLPVIMGDDMQLTRLFQNLVSNALKFRSDENPRIHINAQRENSEWRFTVRDNGIGIDPEFRDRIFIIFQRLHDREEYPGTGIGLAVCKKIVERHGGMIWAEPNNGKGTTFTFTIPVINNSQS